MLPFDLLVEILSYIPIDVNSRIMLVCKDFNRAFKKSFDPSSFKGVAIQIAARNGSHKKIIEFLKDKRVNPFCSGNAPLFHACKYGHLMVVKELLKLHGMNPNFYIGSCNNAAIIVACENGNAKIVEELLNHGVDPSLNQDEPLGRACSKGNLDVVKLLLNDDRVDPSSYDDFAIKTACINGHLEIVLLLLKKTKVPLRHLMHLCKVNKRWDILHELRVRWFLRLIFFKQR